MAAVELLRRPRPDSVTPQVVSAGQSPVDARELALLLVVLLAGFGLRVWQISQVGLSHFDEGVYAFGALGLHDATQPHVFYPEQIKYSPPLYPGLTALAYRIGGGASDTAAILLNVVLGALTIPLAWAVGRAWFGAPAGLATAALLALNGAHIGLS